MYSTTKLDDVFVFLTEFDARPFPENNYKKFSLKTCSKEKERPRISFY